MTQDERSEEPQPHLPLRWTCSWRMRLAVTSVREASGGGLIHRTVDDLGERLAASDYTGPEISPSHAPNQLSTTLSAALSGWLLRTDSDPQARTQAQHCLTRILDEQTERGAWLFPYPFRQNAAGHVYACEMLMTMAGLLDAIESGLEVDRCRVALRRALDFLTTEIGWSEDDAFWYSPTDHIRVPNISSMVASVFARSADALSQPAFRDSARRAIQYCVRTQAKDGAYPYFEGERLVVIPYHALQVTHLCIASQHLGIDIRPSLDAAMQFLDRFVETYGYCPTNEKTSPWLAKTPLWTAMANLKYGRRQPAVRHFLAARALFWDGQRRTMFYTLDLRPRVRRRLDTAYPRYIASAFEIGARLSRGKGGPS